jgi:chromosome partitioning protein
MPDKPLVLTSSNRKGGCAKTSSIFHAGGLFSSRGLRTLLIDCDPQGSLTQSFYSSQEFEQLPDARAVTALFDDRFNPAPAEIIHPCPFANLAFVPASAGLTDFNHAKPSSQGWLQSCLGQFCLEVSGQFDLILINTPPNLQLLTWAALAASDFVLTPVIPEDYAAQGLVHVRRFIEEVQAARNPGLRWLGLVLTLVQARLGVHTAYERAMREAYGELVLNATLPQSAIFKEAVAARTPVTLYKPANAGSKAVIALGEEIAGRAGLVLPEVSQGKKKQPRKASRKEAA